MIWMTKLLFGTGNNVVTDSGFCVLRGIVRMLVHGVYGTTVTDKNEPSNARETLLRHASDTRMLRMFMLFVVIWMGKSRQYSV